MSRALAGKRIAVTRARNQAGGLVAALEGEGAEVVLLPAIAFAPPRSYKELDTALANMNRFDWLVLTSTNTVDALRRRIEELDLGSSKAATGKLRVAAIGPATAAAALEAGFHVDLVPEKHVAEALADALAGEVSGRSVFYPRAEAARDVLPRALRKAGAEVWTADAYRTVVPDESIEILRAMAPPDAVIFSSSSTVRNFIDLLDRAAIAPSPRWRAISIGPITTRTLRDFGWEPALEALEATVAGLVDACVTLVSAGWRNDSMDGGRDSPDGI